MNKASAPVALVGDGRVARHFAHYFKLCGIPYKKWSRNTHQDTPPREIFSGCRAVFLLISDDAIERFARQHFSEVSDQGALPPPLFHVSGSLFVDGIPSLHPLTTFSTELYSVKQYKKIPFVCEKGGPCLSDILPELENACYSLAVEHKGLYHALCVMAGNFTTILWQKAFADFESKLGLPSDILHIYMQQTMDNLQKNSQSALTGPLARRDFGTLAKNIESLAGDPFLTLYKCMVNIQCKGREV